MGYLWHGPGMLRILHRFRTSKCSGGADECSDSSEPGNVRLWDVKEIASWTQFWNAPFFQQRLEKETHCSPTDVINWHGFGTTSVFAVHCWGSHPGTQKWRKKKLRSSKRLKSLSAQDLSNFSSEQKCCDFYDLPRYKEKHLVECLTSFSKSAELVVNSIGSCYSLAEPFRMQWSGVMCLRRAGASGHRDPKKLQVILPVDEQTMTQTWSSEFGC